ncbi:30S ribosomal protein S5 [Patescibacteria group bacterium]|nr:30S ribosomal protein S5 [Patescibacteria group bacterium]
MTTPTPTTTQPPARAPYQGGASRGPRPTGANGSRPPRRDGGKPFGDRVKDVDQKILDIRRVTRVVAGGRRMSFAVSMIIGDKLLGVVGVGTGKGNDTALAIAKALKDAKKNAIKINRTEKHSLPHDINAKYNASRVMLFPNNGKGLVVGAALRDIAVISGLKDVSGKVFSGSKNKLNTARAVLKALSTVGTKHIFTTPVPVQAVPTEAVAVKK